MTRTARPHKCTVCQDTNPENFYGDRKTKCKTHHNKDCATSRPKRGKRKDAFERLSDEDQASFISEISLKNAVLADRYKMSISLISKMRAAQNNI